MNLTLAYGKERLDLKIEQGVDIIRPTSLKQIAQDETLLVTEALKTPFSSPQLQQIVSPGDRIAMIVSDYTRPTGSSVYVPLLIDNLLKKGIKPSHITIVIALGLHRKATWEEITSIVGSIPKGILVENHDPDKNLFQYSSIGIHHLVAKADWIILTGGVTFHPMAGFSGGYKGILPGIASREDILRNHLLYFHGNASHPRVGPAMLEGNPIFNDIRQRTANFQNIFCLNVVLGEQDQIVFAAAGRVDGAWQACVDFIKANYMLPIKQQYPVVLSSAGGYPADYSFYQIMKVFTNSSRACLSGGHLILVARCSHGWELNEELLTLFQDPLEVIAKRTKSSFNMDHLAIYMAAQIMKSYQVSLFSSLPPEQVAEIGINPILDLPTLNRIIQGVHGKRIAVLPKASSLLPFLQGVDVDDEDLTGYKNT